jgi:hypothetical protein
LISDPLKSGCTLIQNGAVIQHEARNIALRVDIFELGAASSNSLTDINLFHFNVQLGGMGSDELSKCNQMRVSERFNKMWESGTIASNKFANHERKQRRKR